MVECDLAKVETSVRFRSPALFFSLKNLFLLAVLFLLPSAVFSANRPNIVFIITDDLDYRMMERCLAKPIDGVDVMPNVRKEIVEQGTALTNFYVPFASC